jgi:hypothetical protein
MSRASNGAFMVQADATAGEKLMLDSLYERRTCAGGPLLLNNGKQLVACILIQHPHVFVVPRQDLFPFAFDSAVCRSIQERLRSAAP